MSRTLKKGDTYPRLEGRITDAAGGVPLGTAVSISLIIKLAGDTVVMACTASNPAATDPSASDTGAFFHVLQSTDTDLEGAYAAEVKVAWSATEFQRFPNNPANNETFTVAVALN